MRCRRMNVILDIVYRIVFFLQTQPCLRRSAMEINPYYVAQLSITFVLVYRNIHFSKRCVRKSLAY
jgi:hypothetical protein